MLLKHLLEQKLPKTAIAQRLGVSRGLIYHWLRTGQLERDLDDPPLRRARAPSATKLDPYKAIITTRLETYPELSAVRLFEECRAAGYTGGITQLRDYAARIRPAASPASPVVRCETPPGKQAPVDFAEVRFPWGKRYAFLVVLGYSRLLWLQFYPRQTMQTVITGLEAAPAAGRLQQRLKTLVFPSLLVVDEIGYLPISRTGAMLCFQLMSRRYEHASTVLTSNKGFEEWGDVFGDEVMASALTDRLVHHCHLVNIRGNSYRMRQHTDLYAVLNSHDGMTESPPSKRRTNRREAPAR